MLQYRYDHSVAQNLNKLLMHESHISRPKKANCSRSLLLNGQ